MLQQERFLFYLVFRSLQVTTRRKPRRLLNKSLLCQA